MADKRAEALEGVAPQPRYIEHIQFEGRDCVVLSPEEYEALWERALSAQVAQQDKARASVEREAARQAADTARIASLQREVAAKQAKIDALMLEYCPDEMTPEQVENWKQHQVLATPEQEAAIDAAMKDAK